MQGLVLSAVPALKMNLFFMSWDNLYQDIKTFLCLVCIDGTSEKLFDMGRDFCPSAEQERGRRVRLERKGP